jgi:hypothetical protein
MEQLMSKLTISAAGEAMPAADHVETERHLADVAQGVVSDLPRRAMLRGLLTLPLAGGAISLAGQPAAAAVDHPLLALLIPQDPIFAAIEGHAALEAHANRDCTDDERSERCDAADEKLHALAGMRPTNLAAACALLLHVAGEASQEHDEGAALPRAVRSVGAALAAVTRDNSAAVLPTPGGALASAITRHGAAQAAFEDGKDHSDEETAQLCDAEFTARRRLVETPCASDGEFFAKVAYLIDREIASLAGFDQGMLTLRDDFGSVVIALDRYLRQRAPRAAATLA